MKPSLNKSITLIDRVAQATDEAILLAADACYDSVLASLVFSRLSEILKAKELSDKR